MAELNKNPLSGIPVGSAAVGWLLLQDSRISIAKNQKMFMSWEGLDITGAKIHGTYFANDRLDGVLPKFEIGTVLAVQGVVGEGAKGPSVWANAMFPVQDPVVVEEFKKTCYPTVPSAELADYIEYLRECSEAISNPSILALSRKMFEFFLPYLYTHPAGRSVHEPIRGGLAKHTYEVVSMMRSEVLSKKGLNKDVVLFASLYHDIGKTQEYTSDLTYSPIGKLLTHISVAMQLITKVIVENQIEVDNGLLRQMMHCILTHHGEHSEIMPTTKEAIALHFVDNMMAKIGHIEELVRRGHIGADGWGNRTDILGTSPYVPELDDRLKK